MPRIVAVPLVAVGHATPMMHLCSYLAKKGFSITFVILAGSMPLKQLIEQRGTWPPRGADIDIVEITIREAEPDFEDWRKLLSAVDEHNRKHGGELEKLVKGIEDGVSTIIAEYQYSWVVKVAAKLGIPAAVLFTGSCTWSWFELTLHRLVFEGLVPATDELLPDDKDTVVCEEPLLRRSDIPWHYWDCKEFHEITIKYNSDIWKEATWVLINSSEAIEPSMVKVMQEKAGSNRYLPVGPLFRANNEERYSVGLHELNRDCLQWLDEQQPWSVLYIAFGSAASLSGLQRKEFAAGLKASGQKFLWVLRKDELGHSDDALTARVKRFALRGKLCKEDETEARAEEEAVRGELVEAGQGMIVSWAPQLEVLFHASVGGFVTHCGWNSTLEGLASGKPMLCWPCLFDQNINSRLIVEDWKVGALLTKKSGSEIVSKERIEETIRMVMRGEEGAEMRSRGEHFRSRLTEASPSLERFVSDLNSNLNPKP